MGKTRARKLALVAVAAVVLGAPAAARGTVTIGSNLGRAPEGIMSSLGCSPPCTVSQATLDSDRQAPGGIVSPVNGTVVLWRLAAAEASSPVAFRVIRPVGGGLWTGAGKSAIVTPATNTVNSFQAQLPIRIGDSIGIDCCQPFAEYFLLSGGTENSWQPPLAEGGPGTASTGFPPGPHEIVLNADIEPTSAFTIVKAKPKKGGKVQVTADLPNPGTLAAGDKNAKLATAAAAKKKTRYLKRASTQLSAPGQVTLVVKATKAARSLLAERGKLKAKLKLVFTPTGGSPSTQVKRVKLKS